MGHQFRQFPWKGQFSLSLLLLVAKLIASGFTAAPGVAAAIPQQQPNQAPSHPQEPGGQGQLGVTPEGTVYVQDVPADTSTVLAINPAQSEVNLVQTLDGTLIAQGNQPGPASLEEDDLLEDIESDY